MIQFIIGVFVGFVICAIVTANGKDDFIVMP